MGVVLRWGWVVLVALLVVGCDQQRVMEKHVPEEESAFAKGVLEDIRLGEFGAVEAVFDPAWVGDDFSSQMANVSGYFPEGEPVGAPDTVGFQWHRLGDHTQYILRYEYEFPDAWVLGTVMLKRDPSGLVVGGVFVEPREASLAEVHAFSFEGKGLVPVLFLGLVVAVPLFILYALVRVFRAPGLGKRKYLWAPFVLVGFMQVTLNWSTGYIHFNPLSFQLFGAGFLAGGATGPWVFIVSIPVGAILFLFKHRGSNKEDTDQSPPAVEEGPAAG